MFTELNFSPFAANPFYYAGNDNLYTYDGKKVIISRSNLDITIHIDGLKVLSTNDMLQACYCLNTRCVGLGKQTINTSYSIV